MDTLEMSNVSEQERLVRIETKLDVVLASDKDKEQRIRDLEKRQAYLVGACLVISVFAPVITKHLFGF